MDRAPSTDGYDIDWNRALELIKKSGASRIGLQAPEGLKRALLAFAAKIEAETGAETVISGDPCFGACDIDLQLCRQVDLMLHIGHADLGDGAAQNVIFLEAGMQADLYEIAAKAAGCLRARTVGVCTTIQHVHKIDQALLALKEQGMRGIVGPAGGRIRYAGQVLGCSYASAKAVDAEEYLFIGTGRFHPLGIALATGKRVVTADPITGEVERSTLTPCCAAASPPSAGRRMPAASQFSSPASRGRRGWGSPKESRPWERQRGGRCSWSIWTTSSRTVWSIWGRRQPSALPAPEWPWMMLQCTKFRF